MAAKHDKASGAAQVKKKKECPESMIQGQCHNFWIDCIMVRVKKLLKNFPFKLLKILFQHCCQRTEISADEQKKLCAARKI
jgi:hypothetical protein